MSKLLTKMAGLSMVLLSLNASAGQIFLEESTRTDSTITVALKGSDFDDGLAAGSFYADWDSSLLEYSSISFNESLYDFVNYVGYLDQGSGFLDDGMFSALTGVDASITSGEFDIAKLTFNILGNGTSDINVSQGWDLFGPQPFYDTSFNEITDVTFSGTSVDVSVGVPEPSSLAILALGIMGLTSRKLKKSA